MRLEGKSFPQAIASLTGGPALSGKTRLRSEPQPSRRPALSPEAVATLVDEAEVRLWTPSGSIGRSYLTKWRRCLTPETIRAAHLGWTFKDDNVPWGAMGIIVPWFNACRLARVKIRVHDGWRQKFPKGKLPPKYLELFRDPALVGLYPGPEVIRPGRPVVIVEGEFDALLLGQELSDLGTGQE
jgi:hypothetical protein